MGGDNDPVHQQAVLKLLLQRPTKILHKSHTMDHRKAAEARSHGPDLYIARDVYHDYIRAFSAEDPPQSEHRRRVVLKPEMHWIHIEAG